MRLKVSSNLGSLYLSSKVQPSYRAVHLDSIIGTIVIRLVTVKDVGYVADNAFCAWVVLACLYFTDRRVI